MADVSILKKLYSRSGTALDFYYDKLTAPPILSLLTPQDISYLEYIANSIKLSSKTKKKFKMIDEVMGARGFKRFAAGTNRLVYRYLENNSIVVKVAYDKVALQDNIAEYRNQFLIKPFCTKVFEVVPSGVVGLFERVEPIKSQEEFVSIAADYFDMLYNKILGKFVMEDIGTKYFMNVGVRANFGPVLLDFPYIYELDGDKLYCNFRFDNGQLCNGEIGYDDGFNYIRCDRCGKTYRARELEKANSGPSTLIIKKGRNKMRVEGRRGNEVVVVVDSGRRSKYLAPLEEQTREKSRIDRAEVGYVNSSTVRDPEKVSTTKDPDDFSEELKGVVACLREEQKQSKEIAENKIEVNDSVIMKSDITESVEEDNCFNSEQCNVEVPNELENEDINRVREQYTENENCDKSDEKSYTEDVDESEHVEINDCIAMGVSEALNEIMHEPRSPFINPVNNDIDVAEDNNEDDRIKASSETAVTGDEISLISHPKHNKKRSARYDKSFYEMRTQSKIDNEPDIKRVR